MARCNPFSSSAGSPYKKHARGKLRMTGRKFLSPLLLALAPQSDHGSAARAEAEAFVQYGPPQSFFQLSWLALQKARREVGDKAQISKPPRLMGPITGVPRARAETEAFFQYGPLQSFFELSWLALHKARAREVAQRLMTGRKFLSPPFLMARSAIRSRECRVRGN